MICALSYGQKRILASTDFKINGDGSIHSLDSSRYHYSSWYNNLSEFKPFFKFDEDATVQNTRMPNSTAVPCDSSVNYSSKSFPLEYASTSRNIISNGYLTTALHPPFTSYNYDYNYDGQITNSLMRYNGEFKESNEYTYDIAGNQTTAIKYISTYPTEPWLIDSSFYLTNSDLKSKRIVYKYQPSSNSYQVLYKWELSYEGDKIDYVDKFEIVNNTLTWVTRNNFTFENGFLVEKTHYKISSDTIHSVIHKQYYDYGANNDLSNVSFAVNGGLDTTSKTSYVYDDIGFVKEIKEYVYGNNTWYFIRQKNYYYQSKSSQADENVLIVLFPNPAQNEITIQTTDQLLELEIVNMNGQVLLYNETETTHVKALSPGEYYVRGRTEKGRFTKAFIKL